MVDGDISATRRHVSGSLNRLRADVAPGSMQIGATGNGSGSDVPAARNRGQITRHVLHDNVTSGGFQVSESADIPRDDRTARGHQRHAPVNVFTFDVSAAGNYIYVVGLGNVQLDGNPQAAARLVTKRLSAEVHAVGSFTGGYRKISEKPPSVFFSGVYFEADFVIDFAGISGFYDDVT